MSLHIATPCHEDWNRMTPDGAGRHCASCVKTVIDLTVLAPGASAAAIAGIAARTAAGENLCVRGHADARGRLRATRARRRLLTNGIAAMIAVAMSGAVGGCADGTTMGTPTATPEPVATGQSQLGRVRAMVGEASIAPGTVNDEPTATVGMPVNEPVPERALMGDVCEPAPQPITKGKVAVPATR